MDDAVVHSLEPAPDGCDVRDVVERAVRGSDVRPGDHAVRDERQRGVAAVEDERPRGRVDEGAGDACVAAEARRARDDQRSGSSLHAPHEHRLVRVDGVLDDDGAFRRRDRRPQDGDLGGSPLLAPLARLLVEPALPRRAGDGEAKLGDVVRAVHVRPDQPFDLSARRERREERTVAEHRGREVLEPTARRVWPGPGLVAGRHGPCYPLTPPRVRPETR